MPVPFKRQRIPEPVKAVGDIGARLLALRTQAGLTLRELSDRSGVSVAHLSRLERGHQQPTTGMLETIAEAFGVDLVDLVIDPGASLRHRVIEATAELSRGELRSVEDLIHGFRDEREVAEPVEPDSVKPKRTSRTLRKRRRRR